MAEHPDTRQRRHPRRGRRHGDATRHSLLDAARRQFAAHGFSGASVRDIAAAAGVHAALVTYHFRTKVGLWEEVVDEAMEALRDRILGELRGATTPTEAGLRALGAYLDHLEAEPDFPTLIVRGLLDRDPVVLGIAERHLRPLAAAAAGVPATSDAIVSLFGAAVAPFLYAPLLTVALGADPLTPAALARRRVHLERLAAALLASLET